MWYRFTSQNAQELRAFAQSKWSMQPAQLVQQNTHRFLMQQGFLVVSSSDGIKDLPLLKLNLDEFTQYFSSENTSSAVLHIRANLIHKQTLLTQKQFQIQIPSASADAAGGAQAMQLAQNQFMQELQVWLRSSLK
jgi:cholesterol transport system auxiliary component